MTKMKKLLVTVALLGMVSMAYANVWNVKWCIGGAYSPDDATKGVLEDYNVTWSLMYYNATTPDTVIASMTGLVGDDELSVLDPGANRADPYLYFTDKLKADGFTTFYGDTNETGLQHVYQYIFIDNGKDQYEWKSAVADITLPVSAMDAATPLDNEVLLGKTTQWTKVNPSPAVPEPATMSLLGLGALAMVLRRKLRK